MRLIIFKNAQSKFWWTLYLLMFEGVLHTLCVVIRLSSAEYYKLVVYNGNFTNFWTSFVYINIQFCKFGANFRISFVQKLEAPYKMVAKTNTKICFSKTALCQVHQQQCVDFITIMNGS